MIKLIVLPEHVTVRWSMYGCDTGCDGYELVDDAEKQLGWTFTALESEEEARKEFNIPDDVRVTFEKGIT